MGTVKFTLNTLPETREEDINRMKAIQDEDIDCSDIPPLPDEFWVHAKKIDQLYRPQKRQVTVRIDADVLDWLKSSGKGYQTRLNEILRHVMLANKTQKLP